VTIARCLPGVAFDWLMCSAGSCAPDYEIAAGLDSPGIRGISLIHMILNSEIRPLVDEVTKRAGYLWRYL